MKGCAARVVTEDTPPPPPAVDIDRGIFRAYDIRGIVASRWTPASPS